MATEGIERLTVAITPEMARMVKDVVQRGEYASASEVFRDALRLWKAHQEAREREVAELRRLWKEGIESGPAEEGSVVFERLRRRYENGNLRKPA
ncbi:MAG TPA: type II toxin-antitoxin system ParD family antitoxin [Geminicoccaceae bacterium]|nr:type II toxin-antitoxin system ParD family antitoxin [Geminicoccaceae bacterium]